MKQDETYDGEKMYWLTCDHCGDFTLQYESPEKLAYEALEAGWRHNVTLGKHFCCLACELEFLGKLAQKTFRPVSGGDAGGGPLSARDVGSASEFHDAAGGGTPQPGGNSAMK